MQYLFLIVKLNKIILFKLIKMVQFHDLQQKVLTLNSNVEKKNLMKDVHEIYAYDQNQFPNTKAYFEKYAVKYS